MAKLTLSIDPVVVSAAKKYAQANRKSLSMIVENYLKSLTYSSKLKELDLKPTPIVDSLKGSIKVPKDFDFKKELEKALIEKHGEGLSGQ